MMSFNILGVSVSVSYPFLAVLTAFLTFDKTGLGGQMFCAALLHELGHLAVMYLFRQPPRSIDFVSFGIRIRKQQSTALSYGKEVLVFLAGPLSNFISAAILYIMADAQFTQLALVHILLGLFNLLPIGALDGGMIVGNLAHCFTSEHTAKVISLTVSLLCLLPIMAASFILAIQGKANVTLIVTSFYLAFTIFASKDR